MNKFSLKIWVIVFAFLFHFPYFAQITKVKRQVSNQKQVITDTDISDLIRIFLKEPDSDAVQMFYLASENLPKRFISRKTQIINGIKFELVNFEEIKKNSIYGFGYYYFEPFEIIGKEVIVTFFRKWNNSTYGESNSTGGKYKCRKLRKKWNCSFFEGILSQS